MAVPSYMLHALDLLAGHRVNVQLDPERRTITITPDSARSFAEKMRKKPEVT